MALVWGKNMIRLRGFTVVLLNTLLVLGGLFEKKETTAIRFHFHSPPALALVSISIV